MEGFTLRTAKDCEDLLVGSTWLATGGGGSIDEGLAELKTGLDEGLTMAWVPVDSIADDLWTIAVGIHGTISPPSQEVQAELREQGFSYAQGNRWVGKSVMELEAYLGRSFECLVAPEVGPGAFADVLTVGARLGIPVVDGDYSGRAVPEELQGTYCLFDKFELSFASADPWGNVAIVKHAANPRMYERMAKMLSVAGYGLTAVAAAPLTAHEMKEIVVRGTMSKCLAIGQAIRRARESGENPIIAGLAIVGGWRLFEGEVTGFDITDQNGYAVGKTEIQGTADYKGHQLAVWFKNENQVSWLDGSPWVCSPDLLTLIRREDARGPYNSEIRVGDQVVAIGMKGLEAFRTEKGMTLAGPRHFGFDIDYVPIEDLVSGG